MARSRTLFTVAAAAVVPTLSHAAAFSTPSFSCTSDPAAPSTLSSIDWGDFSSNSSIIIVLDKSHSEEQSFGCSNGTPSKFLSGGTNFQIEFSAPPAGTGLKWDVGDKFHEKDFTEEDPAGKVYNVAMFDVYMPYDAGAKLGDNFLGIQWKWISGEAAPGAPSFSLDAAGNLILDPSIPPSGVTVSLYNTPQVPEPGSMLLLGAGMAGLTALWRKKRR